MSFNLVVMTDEDGQGVPSYNEKGEVLLHNLEEDSYQFAPISEELVRSYPNLLAVNEPMETANDLTDPKQKAYWTYAATIMLINKYKHYQWMFADSIHKSVEVWDKISNEFRTDGFSFCGAQCENRWKYIRGKYIKKKDNGGPGSTGEELYQFEFYKEMDEVLGKKPNVVPKHLASSEVRGRMFTKQSMPPNYQSNSSPASYRSNTSPASFPSNTPPLTYRSDTSDSGNATSIDLTSNDNATPKRSRKSLESSFTATESSSRIPRSLDTRDLHFLFGDDGGEGEEYGETEAAASASKTTKGKPRKESWDENIQRQDRYHNEMMEVQRESLNTFRRTLLLIWRKNSNETANAIITSGKSIVNTVIIITCNNETLNYFTISIHFYFNFVISG